MTHLLSLADLDAAAPGVLDVIFGPDGDFEGAPRWGGPITIDCAPRLAGHAFVTAPLDDDGVWLSGAQGNGHGLPPPDFWPWSPRLALDLRIPSVSARLAGLCARAGYPDLSFQDNEVIAQARYGGPSWNEAWAVRLAALTLALAPRIAALRGAK